MTKKDLKRKDAHILIEKKLAQGLKKRQILEELSEEYMDKSALEKYIAMTASEAVKDKYRSLNMTLFILVVTTGVIKLIFGTIILIEISIYASFLAVLFPILNLYLALEIYKFRGYVYRIIGLLGIIGLLNNIDHILKSGIIGVVELLLIISMSALAFYLGAKMFPNYKITGHKKDASDNWIFDDENID